MKSSIEHKTEFIIRKYNPFTKETIVDKWVGNLGLNEGLNLLSDLLVGAGGQAYDNPHTYIGVGDTSTAAAATQTGLQGSTNRAWAGMEAGYPTSGSNQQVVFYSIFTSAVGNFAWEEFTVGNSNDDSGENLLRATASKGTKVEGEEWEVLITVTFS